MRLSRTAAFLIGGSILVVAHDARAAGPYKLKLPKGLQEQAENIPDDNPLTREKVALGKLLYFDKRLSADNTVACATCHDPRFGFTDGKPVSDGIRGQKGTRSSPTVINRVFSADQFWDGRAASLEEQAKGPIANPVEMGFSLDSVVERLKSIKGYRDKFKAAFGSDEITIDETAKAIACYERTVVSGNSPYDRYQAGDKSALSPAAQRGMALFNGKANCVRCHTGFNFTDESYNNLGVGWDPAKQDYKDVGRFAVSKDPKQKGAFKTPTLRNIAQTAPYMHDGSENSLADTVEFYDRGGNPNPNLSPEIKPLHLTVQEKADLVAFMQSLTGTVPPQAATPPAKFPK